jgi:hypothetical protein
LHACPKKRNDVESIVDQELNVSQHAARMSNCDECVVFSTSTTASAVVDADEVLLSNAVEAAHISWDKVKPRVSNCREVDSKMGHCFSKSESSPECSSVTLDYLVQ